MIARLTQRNLRGRIGATKSLSQSFENSFVRGPVLGVRHELVDLLSTIPAAAVGLVAIRTRLNPTGSISDCKFRETNCWKD